MFNKKRKCVKPNLPKEYVWELEVEGEDGEHGGDHKGGLPRLDLAHEVQDGERGECADGGLLDQGKDKQRHLSHGLTSLPGQRRTEA